MTKQQRLKILRILAGYDAKKLASAMEISPSTVTLWEKENSGLDVSKFFLPKLAELLGVDADYLKTGLCPNPGEFSVAWLPDIPVTVQHQRATAAIIDDLFPKILTEIGFNFGVSFTFTDSDLYLLGDRDTRKVSTVLLVEKTYKSQFSEIFADIRNILFLPPVDLLVSINDFGSQAIESAIVKLGEVSIGDIPKKLDQFRAKNYEKEIRISLDELRKKMSIFLAAFLKDQPEEHHIAEITNLFVENLRTEQPGITTDDIRRILRK